MNQNQYNEKYAGQIRKTVQEAYGKIAVASIGEGEETSDDTAGSCCGGGSSSCCDPDAGTKVPETGTACGGASVNTAAKALGYSSAELDSVPEGANLGLGCGNPQAIASMHTGETVLDLGSGAGFDCFLAARQVGPEGHVTGVDMTPDMLRRARENAEKTDITNVDFRLGEIEHLPVADQSVDVIISNCVINLSPEKQAVFHEAYRVLKSGGRVAISDIVTTAELPDALRNDMSLYTGCLAGASPVIQIKTMMREAGFKNISITSKTQGQDVIRNAVPDGSLDGIIVPAIIQATKD